MDFERGPNTSTERLSDSKVLRLSRDLLNQSNTPKVVERRLRRDFFVLLIELVTLNTLCRLKSSSR